MESYIDNIPMKVKTIKGKRRILSQGDLRFDVGESVVTLVPILGDNKMLALRGTIIGINSSILSENQNSPRECKIRKSPDFFEAVKKLN